MSMSANQCPLNIRKRQRERREPDGTDTIFEERFNPASVEYIFMKDNHASNTLTELNCLRRENEFCDVSLQVGDNKFPAHKNVLVAFSLFFRTMFKSEYVESKQDIINLDSIEVGMMSLFLNYAYTGTIKITKSNCQSVLSTADFLQVMPVRNAACKFLECHIDNSNCIEIYCFAGTHFCIDLEHKAMDFALKNFSTVSQNEDFLRLTAEQLIEITNNDKLEVEKEEIVFLAVKRWFNESPEDRTKHFLKILETVRLPLIDPYFLYDCIQSFPAVKFNPECMKLIDEAKSFHLLPDRSTGIISNNRTKQRINANVMQVIVVAGGEHNKKLLSSCECFCPATNNWYTLASLPTPIKKHGLVATGKNYIYLAGGICQNKQISNEFWRYDPVFDIWQEMACMHKCRSAPSLVALDGYIYVVGGRGRKRDDEGDRHYLDSVERYDPNTNSWTYVQKLKISVTNPVVIAYGKMLYVYGKPLTKQRVCLNCVQRYDPRTDTWEEELSSLSTSVAKSDSAYCVFDGYIYTIGGSIVETYGIENNRRGTSSFMNECLYDPAIAVLDKKIYVLGGRHIKERSFTGNSFYNYLDSIKCYDPEKNKWDDIGKLSSSRRYLGCVPLQMQRSCLNRNNLQKLKFFIK